MEMTGGGKRGNQKAVPTLPTALGNRQSAIPTFPQHGGDFPSFEGRRSVAFGSEHLTESDHSVTIIRPASLRSDTLIGFRRER